MLPFFLFVIFASFTIVPNIALGSWWNPVDWVRDILSEILQAIASLLYLLSFGYFKVSVYMTSQMLAAPVVGNNWEAMRNLAFSFFGVFVVVIALMNILRVKIEEWGVNKMIPKLAIAAVLVIFSKYICLSLINVANALANAIAHSLNVNIYAPFEQMSTLFTEYCDDCDSTTKLYSSFALLFVALISFPILILCAIIMYFRALILLFLIVTSPIAFALNVLPWTTTIFKKWWDEFIKWTFFYPFFIAIFCIGSVISTGARNVGNSQQMVTTFLGGTLPEFFKDGVIVNLMTEFAFMAMALITVPMAVFLPLKMLGAAGMAGVNNAIKSQVGDRLTGKKGIPGLKYDPKTLRDSWGERSKGVADRKRQAFRNRMINSFGAGRATGLSEDDVHQHRKEMGKKATGGPLSTDQLRDHTMDRLDRSSLSGAQRAWLENFEKEGGTKEHVMQGLIDNNKVNDELYSDPTFSTYAATHGDLEQIRKDNKLHHHKATDFFSELNNEQEFQETVPNIPNVRTEQMVVVPDHILTGFAGSKDPKTQEATRKWREEYTKRAAEATARGDAAQAQQLQRGVDLLVAPQPNPTP